MRLSHKDFDALQKALLDLYEYRDTQRFKAEVPRILLRIVPAEYFALTIYDIQLESRRAKVVDYHESERRMTPEAVAYFESVVQQHPFTKYFMEGGNMTALKFSDFLTLTQSRNSVWHEVSNYLQVEDLISLPVSTGKGTAAITLGNRGRDFTERDRLILNLMRPHFNLAQRNAARATSALTSQTKPLTYYGFTPREAEVVHWVARGKSNPEIAIILGAKVRTVEKHMEHILEKLGVENRTAAAVTATEATERERLIGLSGSPLDAH